MLKREDIEDVDLFVHHETGKAFLVDTEGVEDDAVWISKAHAEKGDKNKDGSYEFRVEHWVLVDKELV